MWAVSDEFCSSLSTFVTPVNSADIQRHEMSSGVQCGHAGLPDVRIVGGQRVSSRPSRSDHADERVTRRTMARHWVLVGLMGSGKSTVGSLLAARTGRE